MNEIHFYDDFFRNLTDKQRDFYGFLAVVPFGILLIIGLIYIECYEMSWIHRWIIILSITNLGILVSLIIYKLYPPEYWEKKEQEEKARKNQRSE